MYSEFEGMTSGFGRGNSKNKLRHSLAISHGCQEISLDTTHYTCCTYSKQVAITTHDRGSHGLRDFRCLITP
jgi:hypothetical protein